MKRRGAAYRLLGAIALSVLLAACNFLSRDELNDIYARGSSQIGYLLQRFPKEGDRGDREWAEAAAIRWCFEYWLSARGPRAFHEPIPFYERWLALGLWRPVKQNKMIDDPLGIRGAYTDGILRDTALFVVPNAIQRKDMKTLGDYEHLVQEFKAFFAAAEAEGVRWEEDQAKLVGRSRKNEGRRDPTENRRNVEPVPPANPRHGSVR